MSDTNRNTDSATHLEPYLVDEPLGAQKAERLNPPFNIHVHVIRERLCDPDGISAKAAIDGLVKARVLPDDSAKYVEKVSYTQEKVVKGEEEKTIITITEARQ
jgi:hypothetical protein